MSATEDLQQKILEALSYVMEPDLKKDIVALGLVSNVVVNGQSVSFDVKVNNPAMHSRKRMEEVKSAYSPTAH